MPRPPGLLRSRQFPELRKTNYPNNAARNKALEGGDNLASTPHPLQELRGQDHDDAPGLRSDGVENQIQVLWR